MQELSKCLALGLVFITYFASAWFGLQLDAISGFATLIWAPSGIALATFLLLGFRYWPAITAAAFLVNLLKGAPFLSALGIGLGNTAEALFAACLLQFILDFRPSMERLRDVLSLLLVTFVSPILSATIGVLSLWAGGVSLESFAKTWWAWWLGDAFGILIIAPVLFVSLSQGRRSKLSQWRLGEAALLSVSLFLVGVLVFAQSSVGFWLFPFLVWAALRFSQRGTVFTVLAICCLAIWTTLRGHGPFVYGRMRDNLLLLHYFMGVISTTGMTLAAALAERRSALKQKSAIFSGALDCIISVDIVGNIQDFNPAAEKSFGYKRSEVLGKNFLDIIVPPRLRGNHERNIERFLNRRVEMTASKRDGAEFQLELTVSKMPFEGPSAYIAFLHDITEQDLARRRLWLQYNVMSTLAESRSPEDLVSKVLQTIAIELDWKLGIFWTFNKETKKLAATELWKSHDLVATEFIQLSKNWEFPIGESLPGLIWSSKAPLWISDFSEDIAYPRSALAKRVGLLSAFGFPILSGDEVVGVMEFLSDRVRVPDDELLRAVRTSGGQIGQVLNRMAVEEELRQAVRARDSFLSIASHELRTPLTSLSLQIQMTKNKIDLKKNLFPPQEKVARAFDISLKQVNRLSGLVNDLLDASRIQTGKFNFNFEKINLTEIVKEMVDRFSDELKKANCSIEVRSPEEIIGHFDQTRIEQVIDNLLSNVIKYAPGKPVKVTLSKDQSLARLVVEDHGPGIPLEKRSRVFERFERASESSYVSGLGLGLFIVKEIVKGHGGSIHLESTNGAGARFVIELPQGTSRDTSLHERDSHQIDFQKTPLQTNV